MISSNALSPCHFITAIAVAAGTNGQTIYAATDDGKFFVTTDGGTEWTEIDPQPPMPKSATSAIVIDPNNPNRVFINTLGSAGGRIWMTTNAGTTWTSIAGERSSTRRD